MKKIVCTTTALLMAFSLSACSFGAERKNQAKTSVSEESQESQIEIMTDEVSREETVLQETDMLSQEETSSAQSDELTDIVPGQVADVVSRYMDSEGDVAVIPAVFRVSGKKYTGQWEEAKANNIYDLAGNNWEWTQERYVFGNYVMRGGGYNLMGGACSGSRYPAALRDPLPGNDHHPNVTFRVALYVK